MARQFFATDYAYGINKALEGGQVYTGAPASGAQTVIVTPGKFVAVGQSSGRSFSAFSTHAPILIGAGANQETVTPSAVTINYQTPVAPSSASITATFSNIQGQGAEVATGTAGLQEAILDCMAAGGGMVVVDSLWTSYGGTTAMITSAYGDATVQITDVRSGVEVWYQWNGAAYAAISGPGTIVGVNGQSLSWFHNTELITLSTSGLTTDSSANLLPANSVILMVTGYVQTTITTTTSWGLGDATTANRFTATNTALTAGSVAPTTAIPPVMIGTGVASATTGTWQLAAAKLRVTCVGSNPGAGKIRVDVYGYTVAFPTS